MMKKWTYITVMAMVLGVANAALGASYHSVVEDASPALRIYNGDDANVTLVVTAPGTNFSFVIDGMTNNINGDAAACDTIVELAGLLELCTNAAGTRAGGLGIFIDQDCSLAADSTDLEFATQTATILPGTWGSIFWDTSVATGPGYSVYIPDNLPKGLQTQYSAAPYLSGGYTLQRVTGNPGGTGNLTTSIYLNRTLVWQQVDLAIIGTVTNQSIMLNEELNLPVKATEALIVRCDRVTTETTGVLTAIAE